MVYIYIRGSGDLTITMCHDEMDDLPILWEGHCIGIYP